MQIVHDGSIKLKGWAYSGGGHWPVRVEVSGDGGSIWYESLRALFKAFAIPLGSIGHLLLVHIG